MSKIIVKKDENKKMTIEDISIVDIEGKEYEIDLFKRRGESH